MFYTDKSNIAEFQYFAGSSFDGVSSFDVTDNTTIGSTLYSDGGADDRVTIRIGQQTADALFLLLYSLNAVSFVSSIGT